MHYKFVKNLYNKIGDDNCLGVAADIAFQFIFSVFPFFLFLVTLMGYLGIEETDIQFMLNYIYSAFPESMHNFLIRNINQIIKTKSIPLLSIAFVGTLWISSNVISSLMFHIDKIQSPQKNRSFWERRPLSLVILFGFFVAIVISSFTILFGREAIEILGTKLEIAFDTQLLMYRINKVYPFITIPLAVYFFYYIAPADRLSLKRIIPGTFFFFIMWYVLTSLFGIYIEQFGKYNIAISILGTMIIAMIWFYMTSLLILIGAEINVVLHQLGIYERLKEKRYDKAH
ncbi:YihY/virulence factor BrkB family protein [candidate division KSB1 bacterium]